MKKFILIQLIVVLFFATIPVQAAFIGGHTHCKVITWSKIINITKNLDDPQSAGVHKINPDENPAKKFLVNGEDCLYEISDITSVTITASFDETNYMQLNLGLLTGTDDAPRVLGENFKGIIFSGSSFTVDYKPHIDFLFNTFVKKEADFGFPIDGCEDADCKIAAMNMGFTELKFKLNGNHYYVDEPPLLLLLIIGGLMICRNTDIAVSMTKP